MKYDYGPLPRDVEEIQPGRMLLLLSLTALALLIYVGVLYNTQIVRHEEYLKLSSTSIVRRETVKASRGIITDRNGVTLISNGFAYDLTFDPSLLRKDQDVNAAILRLLQLCESQGLPWTDTLPITRDEPFAYTMEYLSLEQKRRFLTYLSSLKASRDRLGAYLQTHMDLVDAADLIEAAEAESAEQAEETPSTLERVLGIFKREKKTTNTGPLLPDGNKLLERLSAASLSPELLEEAGIPAADLLDWMAKDLGLPEDYIPWTVRKVLGIRYELQMRKLGDNSVYILTEDVDTPFISRISDGNYAGAKIIRSSVREYETDKAAHIMGTVGPLYSEDLENPLYEGYPLDSVVGKDGVEAAFEQYLHGQDGRRVLSVTEDGTITGEYYSKEPKPGNTVELTIDLAFQEKVEGYLAETVERINGGDGDTARGAGVAVVKVGTGEVLALASYPTFDITTYRRDYNQLAADPAGPLVNKATMGLYAPGSTLKPATSLAALESGTIGLKTRISDPGTWHYPRTNLYTNCWYHAGHGSQVISQAITNSCNVFFAEVGYRMGMDTLNLYYEQLGLGEHTGIEIGDYAGNRPYNPPGEDQAPWAAYGQSNQRYTPLQLANYIATIVSGGRHCPAHLLKAVKSYDNATLLAQGDTTPMNYVEIAPENLDAIRTGMHNLANGSLYRYFQNCVVDAGAKTGTAQLGRGITDNGVFICFAPYEEPEVAIGMVIERASAGANLASTAVNILNAWFDQETDATVTGDYQLLP